MGDYISPGIYEGRLLHVSDGTQHAKSDSYDITVLVNDSDSLGRTVDLTLFKDNLRVRDSNEFEDFIRKCQASPSHIRDAFTRALPAILAVGRSQTLYQLIIL